MAGEASTETYDEDAPEGGPVWEAPGQAEVTGEPAWQENAAATPSWGGDDLDLDERTRADLKELEAQLTSLEAEMERHKADQKKK